MRFKLGNSTIRQILDTQHLNIISIISCFDIFPFFQKYYHYTIYAIISIGVNHTAEPFTLYIRCYLQYSYYRDYFCLLINYIAYLPALRGKYHVFVIHTQKCKFVIFKLGLLRFNISHFIYTHYLFSLSVKYAIQNNRGWFFLYSYTRLTG